jgi:succinate dehydrogenase / fumarate reductase membrane anchor subunit
MALKTPLARVLGLGSAKSGVDHWWWQRITSIALIPLGIWFVWSVISLAGSSHEVASGWLQSPLNAALFVSFVLAVFWHAALGLQVVVEDYVHTEWLKMAVLIAIKLLVALFSVIAVLLVLRIFLGV